ncbi:ran-binding protein [Phyllosticta citriasiana]|uniref:Ran-binding protein n=1 Tax=Phyllosticta citriasiana TaxID=595635 RepID=A0ABR1KV78_9PEZI
MFRRSSYASVAAGTANNRSISTNQPTRSGAFAHLLNHQAQTAAATHGSRATSRDASRSMDMDGHNSGLDSNRAAGAFSGGQFAPGSEPSAPAFFVPSYLEGSRYAERIAEAHSARMSAQRDAKSSDTRSLSRSSSSANLQKMVPSYRGMTHDIIERAPPVSYLDERERSWPTRWSDDDKAVGLELLRDGLEVKCGTQSKTHDEALSVRADHPMPRQSGIYYYEVTVVGKGKEGLIGIGFSGSKVALHRLPGWEPDSWGYHGDDGYSFCSTSSGKAYGPKFGTADVIGCGINFRTNTAFFTKNGVSLVGAAFRNIPEKEEFYPSIGVKKPGEHLRTNFGQDPFVYDIDREFRKEQFAIQREISMRNVSSLKPGLDESALINELIAQYLAHDGYVETARAFAAEVREESHALAGGNSHIKDLEPEEDIDAINRQKIRAAILDGDIDKALKLTNAYYPMVLRENENIYFRLRCRKFIEMIRRCTDVQNSSINPSYGKPSTTSNGHTTNSAYDDVFDNSMEIDDRATMDGSNSAAAGNTTSNNGTAENMDTSDSDGVRVENLLGEMIQYGQELKGEFSSDPRREVKRELENTFALMAYSDPRQSPLAYMLDENGRTPVAEELNSAILVSLGKSSSAALEQLVKQTEALVDTLAEDGGPGAFINVRGDYLGAHDRESRERRF